MERILLMGTDSSHTPAFAKLLAKDFATEVVVVRFPEEFELLPGRKERFQAMIHEAGYVPTDLENIEGNDFTGVCVLAADGYRRKNHLQAAMEYGAPIYVDKPFALSVENAQSLIASCEETQIPLFSSSALRYAEAFQQAMHRMKGQFVTHIELSGPLEWLSDDYNYSWYGIHLFELVVAALGTEFHEVTCEVCEESHEITVHWNDGRRAEIFFQLNGDVPFKGTLVGNITATEFEVKPTDRPFYASLLEEIISFFESKTSPVPTEELLAVIRLVEMAGEAYKKTDNSALSVVYKS